MIAGQEGEGGWCKGTGIGGELAERPVMDLGYDSGLTSSCKPSYRRRRSRREFARAVRETTESLQSDRYGVGDVGDEGEMASMWLSLMGVGVGPNQSAGQS